MRPDARARGTVGHPYSALNLRLALALFGLITMTALTVILVWIRYPGWAVATGLIAMVAAVNIAVVQRRRVQRRRSEPGVRHSMFE